MHSSTAQPNRQQIAEAVLANFGHTLVSRPKVGPVETEWTPCNSARPGRLYRKLNSSVALCAELDPYDHTQFMVWKVSLPTFAGIGRSYSNYPDLESAWAFYTPTPDTRHPLEIAAENSDWRVCVRILDELGSEQARRIAKVCADMKVWDDQYGKHNGNLSEERYRTKELVLQFVADQKERA